MDAVWFRPIIVIVDVDVLFPVTLCNTTLSLAPERFFRRGALGPEMRYPVRLSL
jgi:hypothetical protein